MFVWTNEMITALLDMRFKELDFKNRIENADTNRKKALAWQFFASRLSEKLDVVLTSDQVSNKYKKRKCEYRKGRPVRTQTGNDGREDDGAFWSILNSAFGGRTGIGGTTLADADCASNSEEEELLFSSPENRQKAATPIKTLADTMKGGMTAIAASMGSDDKLVSVIRELQASQEVSRELQKRQLDLLERLVAKLASNN
ncbi:hypothetical protein ON010_g18649 [Phytophthora cinnamomi]|nr:hypothetical protein ON010_g18649 [Phytophthora cinnamomi]